MEENETIECCECGQKGISDFKVFDYEYYCSDCYNDKFEKCCDCKEYAKKDDGVSGPNGFICEDCIDNYSTCEDCDELVDSDYTTCINDRIVCDDCRQKHYFCCRDCEEWYHGNDAIRTEDDGYICLSCYENSYFTCENCSGVYHTDRYASDGYCEDCYDNDHNEFIHYAHYNPGWTRMIGNDEVNKIDNYACGFELEVEGNLDIAEKVIDKFSEDTFICKEDGSLQSGFEVVSHPFTWQWYCENRTNLSSLLALLRKNSMTSHDNGRCGLHIHINKRAFEGTWHMYKFARFIYEELDFIRPLSRRKTFLYCRLSKSDNIDCDNVVKKIKDGISCHHDGLSFTQRTLELRIFRGSLRDISFFASLEFPKALFEFTKIESGKRIDKTNFIKWLGTQKEYETLRKYIIEKNLDNGAFNPNTDRRAA